MRRWLGSLVPPNFPRCSLLLQNDGDPTKLPGPRTQNHRDPATGVGKIWVERSVRTDPDAAALEEAGGPRTGADVMSLTEFDRLKTRRLLKTHAPRQMFLGVAPVLPPSFAETGRPLPIAPGTKVVHTTRNPKDACVSSYYHAANPHRIGFPFDAWAFCWLNGLFGGSALAAVGPPFPICQLARFPLTHVTECGNAPTGCLHQHTLTELVSCVVVRNAPVQNTVAGPTTWRGGGRRRCLTQARSSTCGTRTSSAIPSHKSGALHGFSTSQ